MGRNINHYGGSMKTRIKETRTIIDGVEQVEYLAQVFQWTDALSWYAARTWLDWHDFNVEGMNQEVFAAEFGPKYSIERAKNIIDRVWQIKKESEERRKKQKTEDASRKIKYIRYP